MSLIRSLIDQLNVLANRISPLAFRAPGKNDHVVYVILGPDPDGMVAEPVVAYVGEGKVERATKQFRARGKNDGGFDDYIAAHWPNFEVYLAASNITKSVSLEFEGILIDALKPRFNVASNRSTSWRDLQPGPDDLRPLMRGAERLDFHFPHSPPPTNQIWHWKRTKRQPPFSPSTTLRLISRDNPWRPGTPGHIFHCEVLSKDPATVTEAVALAKAVGIKEAKVQRHLKWLFTWHGGAYLEVGGLTFQSERD